jgi:ABC-type dipeptide/oligopeptide/nickel transport system permease subunit
VFQISTPRTRSSKTIGTAQVMTASGLALVTIHMLRRGLHANLAVVYVRIIEMNGMLKGLTFLGEGDDD